MRPHWSGLEVEDDRGRARVEKETRLRMETSEEGGDNM